MNHELFPAQIQMPNRPGDLEGSFIRSTYRWLFFALAAIAVLAVFSSHVLPKSSFGPLGTADGLIWVVCGWFGWRNPVQVAFPLFVTITGLFLGQLAQFHMASFLMASILTPIAFAGLSLYVHFTKTSFSFLRGFLAISFFIILGSGLLLCFFHNHLMELLLVMFGVLVFACWILYDTSQILERADEDFTPGIAAFELIIDIVGLHRWVMDLLQSRD
jgi:FtsH-binding integral membrane protein